MKTTHRYYLTVSVGWESRRGSAGSSVSRSLTRLHSRSWQGLQSPLKTHSCGLGRDAVPWGQLDWGLQFLAGWWLEVALSSWVMRASLAFSMRENTQEEPKRVPARKSHSPLSPSHRNDTPSLLIRSISLGPAHSQGEGLPQGYEYQGFVSMGVLSEAAFSSTDWTVRDLWEEPKYPWTTKVCPVMFSWTKVSRLPTICTGPL